MSEYKEVRHYQQYELGTSDTSIPIIPFDNGVRRSVDITNPNDALGVGLIISRLDVVHKILKEDKRVVEDIDSKPYLLLYFQNPKTVDTMISALNDVKGILEKKNREDK